MPRRRVRIKSSQKLPAGVHDAVQALALDGVDDRRIGRAMGLDPVYVRRLVSKTRLIDPAAVAELRRALPSLLAVLATAHSVEALERAHRDPANSVKSTFGAKLALEASNFARPAADSPGVQILAFIQSQAIPASAPATPALAPEARIVDAQLVADPGDGSSLASQARPEVSRDSPAVRVQTGSPNMMDGAVAMALDALDAATGRPPVLGALEGEAGWLPPR